MSILCESKSNESPETVIQTSSTYPIHVAPLPHDVIRSLFFLDHWGRSHSIVLSMWTNRWSKNPPKNSKRICLCIDKLWKFRFQREGKKILSWQKIRANIFESGWWQILWSENFKRPDRWQANHLWRWFSRIRYKAQKKISFKFISCPTQKWKKLQVQVILSWNSNHKGSAPLQHKDSPEK